jgi:hypothetical protein
MDSVMKLLDWIAQDKMHFWGTFLILLVVFGGIRNIFSAIRKG